VCLSQALPRWIVFNELVLTSKEYVRTVSEIKPGALLQSRHRLPLESPKPYGNVGSDVWQRTCDRRASL